jgi:hypothetical protein
MANEKNTVINRLVVFLNRSDLLMSVADIERKFPLFFTNKISSDIKQEKRPVLASSQNIFSVEIGGFINPILVRL